MKKMYISSLVATMLFSASLVGAQTTEISKVANSSNAIAGMPIVYEAEALGTISSVNGTATVKTETNAVGGSVVFFSDNNTTTAFNSFSKVLSSDGGTGGDGTLTIRYSNGNAFNGSLTLYNYINGSSNKLEQLTFVPTGSWSTFSTITVTLPAMVAYATTANAFKLQKIDNSALSLPSDVGGVEIDNYTVTANAVATALKSIGTKTEVSIYPRLVKDNVLNISNVVGSYKVIVLSVNGQTVFTSNANIGNTTINTSLFSKGIYLVKVIAGEAVTTAKVIVQ